MMEHDSEKELKTEQVDSIVINPGDNSSSDDPFVEEKNRGTYFKGTLHRYKIPIAAGILVLILIISVVLGVTLSGGNNSNQVVGATQGDNGLFFDHEPQNHDGTPPETGSGSGSAPVSGGSRAPGTGSMPANAAGPQSFLTLLENTFNSLGFPERHFAKFNTVEDTESHQLSALQWITQADNFDSLSDSRKLQRYALATFFYSTYAMTHPYMTSELPWKSEDNWMSDQHECDWEGVLCNAEDGSTVIGIELNDHRISGTLPLDLGILGPTLTKLHLAANFVYMDGPDMDVFSYLTELKDLKMDDNYVVARSGLPSSLSNLSNLQKLILSYNLLQGTIPSNYFANMRQLSHLEVESNYIAGSLPHSLMNLESLVYLYVRRNTLHFSFAQLLQQIRWPNIFSLWFDNNNITGPIPTEIGMMTGLASLSITNSSLVGTIPTELGSLSGLRRAWFYSNQLTGPIPSELDNLKVLEVLELHSNQLTGDMPSGVCSTIAKSTYRFKELSANCNEVQCADCCTKCF